RNDPGNTCGDDRIGTRRRLSVMRARLQRHVDRGVARALAGLPDCFSFGMRAPARLRYTTANNDRTVAIIAHNDCANGGVWPGATEPPAAKRQRQRHETLVPRLHATAIVAWEIHVTNRRFHFRCGAFSSSSPESSASAVSKSFASRKFR